MNAKVKYVAVCVVTGAIDLLTYLQGQTTLTEGTTIGAGLLLLGLALHDLEDAPADVTTTA